MIVCLTGEDLPLGQAISQRLRSGGIEVVGIENALFIKSDKEVRDYLSALTPTDYIVHAAELSWEQAEQNPADAQKMNVHSCLLISDYARKCDAPLILVSSFMIFDGAKKNPYISANSGQPLNVYGRTKMDAEASLIENYPRSLLIRLGWLLDADRNSWLGKLLRQLLKGETVVGYTNVKMSPTPVDDVARVIDAILKQLNCGIDVWGIYHYAGTEPVTHEVLLRTIHYQAKGQDLLESQIVSDKYQPDNSQIKLPLNCVLGCIKLRNTFGIKQLPWRRYLPTLIEQQLKNQSTFSD